MVLYLQEGDMVPADNMATLSTKMRQVTQGFVYHEDGEVSWMYDAKYKEVDRIISENQGAPTIIVYQFKEELKKLQAQYPHADYLGGSNLARNEKVIEKWNAGDLNVLFLHPLSGGHGLNLQHGGSRMVWIGLPWSLEQYQQTVARLHRPGQKEHVWVYHIISSDTMDQRISNSLIHKENIQDTVYKELTR
jgi:SNF2 family DNA or RNA helicase